MPTTAATSETLHLTLTLPQKVAKEIRTQVASGAYSSESEYVETVLLSHALFEPIDEDELTHWMNTEGVRRLEAMRADPSGGLTVDEAFAGLIDEEPEQVK
jgi:Arc/MetJ-type ribon-helix-helix transcriptional regulator